MSDLEMLVVVAPAENVAAIAGLSVVAWKVRGEVASASSTAAERSPAAPVPVAVEEAATVEPWPGYSEQTVAEIAAHVEAVVPTLDRLEAAALVEHVEAFEAAHKDRRGVRSIVDAYLAVFDAAEGPGPFDEDDDDLDGDEVFVPPALDTLTEDDGGEW